MNTGSWVLLMLAAVITVGYGGYLLGRRNSEQRQEIDRLQQELNATRERADQIRSGVNAHFEQSAVIFGQLAKDYRQFLDHFQSSAKELGLSEERAEELLDQVARPLLAHDQGPPATAAIDAAAAPAPPETASAEPAEASAEPPRAASNETPAAAVAKTGESNTHGPARQTASKTGAASAGGAANEQASTGGHTDTDGARSGTTRT